MRDKTRAPCEFRRGSRDFDQGAVRASEGSPYLVAVFVEASCTRRTRNASRRAGRADGEEKSDPIRKSRTFRSRGSPLMRKHSAEMKERYLQLLLTSAPTRRLFAASRLHIPPPLWGMRPG